MTGSPLVALLNDDAIRELTTPSNRRYGQAIHDRGGVERISTSDTRVDAWVGGLEGPVNEGGGQRRRVRMSATKRGLTWHCACSPKDQEVFCKHCVALARDITDGIASPDA